MVEQEDAKDGRTVETVVQPAENTGEASVAKEGDVQGRDWRSLQPNVPEQKTAEASDQEGKQVSG